MGGSAPPAPGQFEAPFFGCVFRVLFSLSLLWAAFCVFELGSALNCKGRANTQTHAGIVGI